MDVHLRRILSTDEATVGIYTSPKNTCFIIEDQKQEGEKVPGETRIPAGRYRILLRDEGGMTSRYNKRFPGLHQGMLHLQDVPDFTNVYIHIGNDDDDTLGCLLTNTMVNLETMIGRGSASAYRSVYEEMVVILEDEDSDEEVWLTIEDDELD